MSAFDDKSNQTEEEQIDSYLAKLIEEKGENWKDPEVIAKGKYEADRFISDLKRQNEELRAELDRSAQVAELLETLKAQKKSPDAGGEPITSDQRETDHTDQVIDEDKIRALIESRMSERESQTTQQKNIQTVEAELDRRFGDSASSVLRRQAAELEMTVEEARELAATKPKAFFRLMGLDSDANKGGAKLVGGGNRSEATFNSGPVRDWEYYQKLRREKKSYYFSPSVQRQMMQDREALGERFGMPR